MKLCPYHRDALRSALQAEGIDPGSGAAAPIWTAESLVIAKVLAREPSVTSAPGCPICILMVPSWIPAIARHLAQNGDLT